jgi:adhesin/invasin
VTADGSSTSVVTITLKDATNNPVPDLTPTFSATDTGSTNSYSACSVTDSFGISTCTFTSMSAETKNLTIVSPVHRSGGTVDFIPGAPDAAYSTITGSGPVVADGSTTSTITITILDAFHNPISGETPTFSATNTGSTNNYTTCSATDAFGVSTCTMKSTKAEVKTLSITSPVTKSDGSVTFTAGSAVAANSHITGSGPIPADGSTASTITITLNDAFNNPVSSITPNFSATGSNNGPGICSATDATGVSSCSLTSTTSETKTLSITYPFTKADGTVQFIAGFPVAANSSITGTSTVIANGVATSTITISLNDASNNPVAGQTPTFSATDTGTTNSYGTCSASNTSGISTCTLASTKAEIKTLAIVTPVAKTGGTVTFIAGSVAATYSTIAGTTNITADGIAASTVTVTLYDAFNNPVAGSVPTFNATNTGTTNIYGVCGSSNTSGVSTCSLKSTKAETKTLAITAPVAKTGSTVIFIAGSADSAHSDITGTGPVSADGMSLSFITINLGDAYGNPIVGTIPIFNATDSGTNNIYGACSATNTSGVSSCSLASAMAETKTLQLTSPIAVTGSTTVTFSAGGPTALNSTIVGTSSIVADGSTSSTITITLKDSSNNVVPGWTPTFDATDTGSTNGYIDCSMSDPFGVSICYLTSTKAEAKTLRITSPVTKLGSVVTFIAGSAVAANSSISGTSPTTANGMDLSTITINLKDNYNNPVAGTIPTFSATNTGTTNVYGVCSSTDALGNSTCSLKSTKAESKIPQILTPVSKSGGAISFNPDLPSATNTTISGTGPVNPDGTSTSTITITIKDAYNNPISGTIPTFSATGANNSYGICSSSNTSGSSTCTMASTTAQIKTLSLLTPISVSGGTVEFKTGSAVVANSTITGTGPVKADGILTSTITITLKDSLNLPVTGEIPVFSASGTGNTISTCSATNSFGVSTCTLKSTKAEIKTLSITSPIVKPNGTVTFIPGDPSVASSTIVASGPCKATGTDVCSVTITIKDAQGNAISGSTPTFSLSGTLNTLNACSVTNSSGISTCGATSTKAESKTFQLLTPVSVAGNSVDFNPNGINIQVPIEMLDRGISSKTTALTFARSRTTLNTNDYVGQMTTYQFEIVADNTNATIAYNVSLVNSLGTIVPGSSISVPPATTTKRFNITWTPTSGADNYRVQIAAASGSNIVKVHSARIIVEQTAAIETKIYIPLVGGDATGETNVDTTAAAATSVTGTSLAQTPVNNYYPWTRTDTKYDTIASGNSWTLEAVIASNATSATATAQLVDSGGLTIGSALTATATTPTLVSTSFASTATNFNDGDVLSLKLKSSTATNIAYVFRAGLWVKLKFLKKTEIPFRLLNRRSASTTAIMPDARFLWDAGAWSNPTTYFEIYAMKSSGTSTISLMDHSNIDNGTTSPTPTAVSTLTPPTAYGVYRSPTAITLTDMDRYIIQHVSTSTTAHVMGGAFVIIQARD